MLFVAGNGGVWEHRVAGINQNPWCLVHIHPSGLIYRSLIFSVHIKRGYIYVSWVRKDKIGHLSPLKIKVLRKLKSTLAVKEEGMEVGRGTMK